MTGNVSDDGKLVIIGLKSADGTEFQTALNAETLSKCVGFMLGLAETTAQRTAPEHKAVETITAAPLQAAQIGVARGQTDSEAILAVRLGILQIAFSTELATLLGMCSNLQSIVERTGTPPKRH